MTRPTLREVPLSSAWPRLRPGEVTVTMTEGQWDSALAALYAKGCVLLELDKSEVPVRAYQRASA